MRQFSRYTIFSNAGGERNVEPFSPSYEARRSVQGTLGSILEGSSRAACIATTRTRVHPYVLTVLLI